MVVLDIFTLFHRWCINEYWQNQLVNVNTSFPPIFSSGIKLNVPGISDSRGNENSYNHAVDVIKMKLTIPIMHKFHIELHRVLHFNILLWFLSRVVKVSNLKIKKQKVNN